MKYLILVFAITLSGCQSLKKATGDYVVDSVQKSLLSDIDDTLKKRGLTRDQLKDLIDTDSDNKIDKKEIVDAVAGSAKDVAIMEARKLIESELGQNSSLWNWLLGLVAAYLSKQVYSIRRDKKRLLRLEALEKALKKDLDGDGIIGHVSSDTEPAVDNI